MVERWQAGLNVLVVVALALGGGALGAVLIWGFVVVIPGELLFDAVWLEAYWLLVAAIGAGTAGVHKVGQVVRLAGDV